MKKPLILTMAASALALGSTAVAQDRPERLDRNADITRAEAATHAAERFAHRDANNDGVLNAEDREARARERFAEADANGDGLLSFEEMQARHEQRRAMHEERREQAGERQGRRGDRMGRRGHRGMRGAMMMQRADTDNDGAISQAEFTTAALARFDRADANSDGTLTAEERQAHREERRENRRERRERRQ